MGPSLDGERVEARECLRRHELVEGHNPHAIRVQPGWHVAEILRQEDDVAGPAGVLVDGAKGIAHFS
jgi:hypothetical protein